MALQLCMRFVRLWNTIVTDCVAPVKLMIVFIVVQKMCMGKVAAGIWPWKCKDALFRYNEAADTRLNQDGMAYDADSGDGTTYEYNYSRQNEGGCVMFCLDEAIHNTFSHNVSV